MHKPLAVLLILVTIPHLEASDATAGISAGDALQESPILATRDLLYNRIVALGNNGDLLAGLLVGIRDDSLLLIIGGQTESVSFDDLMKVTIRAEKKTSQVAVLGAIMGVYLGELYFMRPEGQPAAFRQEADGDLELLLFDALFAAAGGGLAYLLSPSFERDEHTFELVGLKKKRDQELERLRQIVSGVRQSRKVHFSIQGSRVFSQVANQYSTLFENAGYAVDPYFWVEGARLQPASNVNLLRKLQLTYSVTRKIGIGAALAWVSEPSIGVSRFDFGDAWIIQSLKVPAYFAVATYNLRPPTPTLGGDIVIGLGLGMADIDFRLKAQRYSYGPDEERVEVDGKVTTTRVSGMMFGELIFPLTDWISIGLTGDHVFIPPIEVPGLPDFDIPAQTLRLGNSSIGIRLGFDF